MMDNCILALALLVLPVEMEPLSSPADCAVLIGQLGSDSFRDREKATKFLRRYGWGARQTLEAASNHDDPEVRHRVRQLLEELYAVPAGEEFPLICCLAGPTQIIPEASLWRQPFLWMAQREKEKYQAGAADYDQPNPAWELDQEIRKAACASPRRLRAVLTWWYMGRALRESGYDFWYWPESVERHATCMLLHDLRRAGVKQDSLRQLAADMKSRSSPVPLAMPNCPQWIKRHWGYE